VTRVRELAATDERAWEDFVHACPSATVFHRLPWREVIVGACGGEPIYLLAEDEAGAAGVLPLFVLRTGLFGTMAVSLPFLNYGGVAARDEATALALLAAGREAGERRGCAYVEYRHRFAAPESAALPTNDFKETGVLDLAGGLDFVWKSRLHQNARNKVRKAEKNEVKIERGADRLDDFYGVFAANQRDHGTPVLPKRFFAELLARFGVDASVYAAYRASRVIAAKVTVDFRDTRHFIWSASLREANQFAPVSLMNWTAIQDAAAAGLTKIDFGRSTRDSSSQAFKKQWGVSAEPLLWQYHLLTRAEMPGLNTGNPKFQFAIRLWRRLPLWLTRVLGPPLARRLP
jgi:FemAB-related protein (PEP-CTERM system-associated)